MNEVLLQKYARLIVKIGANVQNGQKVRLCVDVDQVPLATLITEECYKAGASRVEVEWSCGQINRLHYQYAAPEVLGEVLPWEEAKQEQYVKDLPVYIRVLSMDPDELSGISPDVISTVTRMRAGVLKKYRDQMDGKYQWTAAGAPSVAWAKKVFPGETDEVAVEKLWQAILSCVYLTEDCDPEQVWNHHTEVLTEKMGWLNEQNFTSLHYTSANGTDFTVELIPGAKWSGAKDFNHGCDVTFVPNLPTEEIFTSPMRGKAEGRLVSTKALSWSGQLINNFSVDFKDGKVCDCHAEEGEEILKKMFAIDEGAAMLGEVALVPKESSINQSGLLFYNTLFDENACCHVAVGRGFGEVIEGYTEMTKEELYERGINDSMIHVDFMVGSEDLNITGIREDGTEVPVFINGTWA